MQQRILFLLIFSFPLSLNLYSGFPRLCSCCKDDIQESHSPTLEPTALTPRPASSESLCPNPITLTTIKDAYAELEQADSSTVAFFDIDDTLLETSDPTFQSRFIYRREYAKNFFYTFEYFWRTQKTFNWYTNFLQEQQRQLVEPEMASYIQQLQKKGATVLAITAVNAGSSGTIPDMHEFRHQELTRNGISFDSPLDHLNSEAFNKLCAGLDKAVILKRGILTSGRHSKGLLMSWFIENLSKPPTKVLFFDDSPSNHGQAILYLKEKALTLSSFFYIAARIIRPEHTFDTSIARIQLNSICIDNHYISYQEAAKRLAKKPTHSRAPQNELSEMGSSFTKLNFKETTSAILPSQDEKPKDFFETMLLAIETTRKRRGYSALNTKSTESYHPAHTTASSSERLSLQTPDSTICPPAEEMVE